MDWRQLYWSRAGMDWRQLYWSRAGMDWRQLDWSRVVKCAEEDCQTAHLHSSLRAPEVSK